MLPYRIENADLSYAVLTVKVKGGFEMLDGTHRFHKAANKKSTLNHIVVSNEMLEKAVVKPSDEIEGKQYANIIGKMVDVEKLFELTKNIEPKPLDLNDVVFKDK